MLNRLCGFATVFAMALAVSAQEAIPIGQNRECFFDDYLLDTAKTTAEFRVHQPELRGPVMTHDAPWEGSGCDYHNFFFDDSWPGMDGSHPNGVYRMYYLGWQAPSREPNAKPQYPIVVCYAESADGLTWTKPNLGLCTFNGSKDNNIVVTKELLDFEFIDNFMVFRDENPACPKEERYKGIALFHHALWSFNSPDGLHFTLGNTIATRGVFDTVNIVFWDSVAGKYRGYIRGNHFDPKGRPTAFNGAIRDINYVESTDFKTWTDPVLLKFGPDKEDIALYTNVINPYFRAPQMLLGFPSRYVERVEWNGSFEQLTGLEKRRKRMEMEPRFGMAITDCVFIVSRNGKEFTRYMEAFMRPGPENGDNWLYGDCYPALGFAVTPGMMPGSPDELSLYAPCYHWMQVPSLLLRYAIRMDGFVSLHAGGEEKLVVTKPLTYDGKELFINFATSAMGWLYVTLIDENGKRYPSCETFGDAIERKVVFDDPEAVATLSGKPVTIEFKMWDTDIYSMHFK